jgi:hypothetical protein
MDLTLAIASLPLWLAGLLLIVVPTLITVCGPLIVRRFMPLEDVMANNEVAGFKFATLGVVYAVLLGLAVISVWEKFANAEAASTREAAGLASMYRLSAGIDTASAETLRAALTDYARSAVEDDWPAMAEESESPKTLAALNALYAATLAVPAADGRGTVLLNSLLGELDVVTEARRERLTLADGIIPGVIWLVLFSGAALTLGFTFFFGLRNLRAQLLMSGMLALVIFLSLFVALSIDHPFTGSVRVPPEPIALVLHDFGTPPAGSGN